MKHIQELNENFKLVDLGNSRWFGSAPDDSYKDRVKSMCIGIMMDETGTSEKSFSRIDRISEIYKKCANERSQEIDAIVHNCAARGMRAQLCAETVYDAVLKGRVAAMMQRHWDMGGLNDEK